MHPDPPDDEPPGNGEPNPALREALLVVGDRWTLLVVNALLSAPGRHFRELLRHLDGIASNILADRLRLLCARGLVSKQPHPEHKQKALYTLTEWGAALAPLLDQLASWGERLLQEDACRREE